MSSVETDAVNRTQMGLLPPILCSRDGVRGGVVGADVDDFPDAMEETAVVRRWALTSSSLFRSVEAYKTVQG